MLPKPLVYIALGGNIGDTRAVFDKALIELEKVGENLKVSKFYTTKPVSTIEQPDYLNGCASFLTSFSPRQVFEKLEEIERKLGKIKKNKDEPRIIDLDLLFYGEESFHIGDLIIPHPRFHERLFVLEPLLDLTEQIGPYNIKNLIDSLKRI